MGGTIGHDVTSDMTLNEELLEWELSVPNEFRHDSIWHSTAYRMGLFISERCQPVLDPLFRNARTAHAADQLSRALESISATYAEGYSRSTIADRCRYFDYALGSTRESRDWSYKLRRWLPEPLRDELVAFLTRIIQLLTVTIVRERERGTKRIKRRAPRDA
jgi:four helix bundle protein